MGRGVSRYWLSLWFFCLIVFCSVAKAEVVYVAVASNFSKTIKELSKDFKKKTGIAVSISQASTGKLYAQIFHGAPYDVF
ncbi:MAG: substrate-binding domain-containing protein, partial [Gammaproteobacteria bacterium]|nr:substrate-binding domain-containing protein [Gammaproteobacteria bacterium]